MQFSASHMAAEQFVKIIQIQINVHIKHQNWGKCDYSGQRVYSFDKEQNVVLCCSKPDILQMHVAL